MTEAIHTALIILLFAALGSSVFHSVRQRRQKDPTLRGLYAARMNISMGILLLAIAAIQAVSFEMNSPRLVLATVFALLGLFNLFAGLRNHSFYQAKRG